MDHVVYLNYSDVIILFLIFALELKEFSLNSFDQVMNILKFEKGFAGVRLFLTPLHVIRVGGEYLVLTLIFLR